MPRVGPVAIPNPIQPLPRLWTNLNRIKTITESTCDKNWWLLLETAIPAAGDALWCIITPDPKRIVEDFLEPGGGGLGKGIGAARDERWVEGETGRLRKWAKYALEDPSRRVANHLPGRKFFKGRKIGVPEKWLWGGIDILAELGWYWLIADVAADFTAHWYSGLVQSRFCQSPAGTIFDAVYDKDGGASGLWGLATDLTVVEDKNVLWFNGGQINRGSTPTPQQGVYEAKLDITREIPSGGDWHIELHAHITLTDGTRYSDTVSSDDVKGSGTATAELSGQIADWREIVWNWDGVGAGYTGTPHQHAEAKLLTFNAT